MVIHEFCIYHIQRGGIISGSRLGILAWPLEAVEQLGAQVVHLFRLNID